MRTLVRVLDRHRKKCAALLGTVFVLALLVAVLAPRSYRSEGKLLVRLGRENLGLDPTAMIGATPLPTALQQSRESEINSVIEILRSRAVIERVVDSVGADVILGDADFEPVTHAGKSPSDERGTTANQNASATAMDDRTLSDRDAAIRWLNKKLEVEAARKSNVLQVSCEARSPALAQAIVRQLIDDFLDDYIRLNRTPGAERFLSEQTAAIQDRLKQREEELCRLKQESGLTDPEQQRTVLVSRIGRLEDECYQTAALQASGEAEVARFRNQMVQLPEREVTVETTGFTNEGTDGMRQQLYTLELREQDMASRFTDEHPQLKQVRMQLAEARAVHRKELPDRTQKTTAKNKNYDELNLLLMKQEAIVASLKAKAQRLAGQLALERKSLEKLNADELIVSRAEREMLLEESNYRRYADSLEQARIDGALAAEGKSNISVVQPASYERKPVRPSLLMILVVACFLGPVGAVGLALACESMDETIKTPEELEQRLEAPVLASIPRQHAYLSPGNGARNS